MVHSRVTESHNIPKLSAATSYFLVWFIIFPRKKKHVSIKTAHKLWIIHVNSPHSTKPEELHRSPPEMPNAFERHWRRLPLVLHRKGRNSSMVINDVPHCSPHIQDQVLPSLPQLFDSCGGCCFRSLVRSRSPFPLRSASPRGARRCQWPFQPVGFGCDWLWLKVGLLAAASH